MRAFIAVFVLVYLVGVGVVLAPALEAGWSAAPASQLSQSVGQELPSALAWPAAAYRRLTAPAT
jgi:hypothetical protein